MKYRSLDRNTVNRIWTAFTGHPACVNERYCDMVGKSGWYLTDRDRFVERLLHAVDGRYIAFIDRILIGYMVSGGGYGFTDGECGTSCAAFSAISEVSTYSTEYRGDTCIYTPYIVARKQYAKIIGFGAVNSPSTAGYIKADLRLADGRSMSMRLDSNTLHELQFAFIEDDEFSNVASLFLDDREPVEYVSERALQFDEMVARKLVRKNVKKVSIATEPVSVMARDRHEALEKIKSATPDGFSRIMKEFEAAT